MPRGRIPNHSAPRKTTTRREAANAVGREKAHGRLPILSKTFVPCVDCGERAEHYDHRDYEKPIDVSPVCRRCNYKRGPAKNDREVTVRRWKYRRIEIEKLTRGKLKAEPLEDVQ